MKDKNVISERRPNGTLRVATLNPDPSLTQQQFKEECDINTIMNKYIKTGEFRALTGKGGIYADFSEIKDLQSMLDTVRLAQDAFASLPAQVRQRFANDPAQLLEFIQDTNNRDEAIKLGLIDKPIPSPNDEPSLPTNDDMGTTTISKTKPLKQKNLEQA